MKPLFPNTFNPGFKQGEFWAGNGTSGVVTGVCSTGLTGAAAGCTGFAGDLMATPLFQTSRLPLFTQVNFLSALTEVAPALAHFAPALTAAVEGATPKVVVNKTVEIRRARNVRKLLILRLYKSLFSQ